MVRAVASGVRGEPPAESAQIRGSGTLPQHRAASRHGTWASDPWRCGPPRRGDGARNLGGWVDDYTTRPGRARQGERPSTPTHLRRPPPPARERSAAAGERALYDAPVSEPHISTSPRGPSSIRCGFDLVEGELGHVERVERGTPAASLIWLAPFFSCSRTSASTAGTPAATVKNPSCSMWDARRRTAGADRHRAGINRVRPRRQRSFRCPANRTPTSGKS